MKTAFIVCSRADSSRLPAKPFKKINGRPVLTHLLNRLAKTKIPIILAIPGKEFHVYDTLAKSIEGLECLYLGSDDDPLERMYHAAKDQEVDTIIRVTHDKIFVDPDLVLSALDQFNQMALDYLYSSEFTDGSGFEIISFEALEKAAKKFKKVEYISYAIKAVTENIHHFDVPEKYQSDCRLLIDYPEDMQLMQTIFSIQSNPSLEDAINLCNNNDWVKSINRLPSLTVYTCAYNAEKYLEKCMGSVARQKGFKDFEYIIVDDCSTDKTYYLASKFASTYKNVTLVRNEKNLGLASSSNVALKHARGKYIMRLDADDFFVGDLSLRSMLNTISTRELDVVYPNNYHGDLNKVQSGKEQHHVGGAIFSTRAINHIRFTDGLRNYEGLDFFERAKDVLKVGYFNRPIFYYRQHDDSMSKTNLEERAKTKERILNEPRP